MKIRIKEDEVYEIKIPEEINASDILILLDRLKVIAKLSELSEIRVRTKTETRSYVKKGDSPSRFWNTREKALDLLQYAYHGTEEDKERISKLIRRDWKKTQKQFHLIKKRYNIQPDEVGLTKWKTQYDSKNLDVRIPNWTIKSYTGIFDENGNTDEENGNN
jgi:hypothetical protein